MRLFKNNAASILDLDLSNVATTLEVAPAGGEGFPVSPASPEFFMLTIEDGDGNIEIVKCTGRTGDVFTIVRAQEGTSARAFTVGDKVELRLTAGTLESYEPGTAITGANSVALGYAITGTGDDCTVFGNDIATAAYNNVTIVGYSATVGGGSAAGLGHNISVGLAGVAIGSGSTAAQDSVAVGTNATTGTAQNSTAVGRGADAQGVAAFSGGAYTEATGEASVSVGSFTQATGQYAVAIGRNSVSAGLSSVALGNESSASNSSVALGGYSVASGINSTAVGIQASATHRDAIAVGTGAVSSAIRCTALATKGLVEGGFTFQGFPVTQREDFWYYDGDGAPYSTSAVATVSSPPVDLGPGVAWVASTAYKDQDVVVPTTPNNKQYYLWHGAYDGSTSAVNTVTTGATEPTWPTTTPGDDVSAEATNTHYWIMVDPLTGISMNVSNAYGYIGSTKRVKFYPTRVGFICYNYATLSAAPYISIGNGVSATAYVNNQQLTGITQSGQMQWFDVTNPVGADDIVFTLETAGVGASGQCHGRFFVQGMFMQTQD